MKMLSYFLGAMRDGCFIRNVKNSTYRIRIYQKNKKWIEELAKISEDLFGKKPLITLDKRDNVWSLMINSRHIYEAITRMSNYPGTQSKWNTPEVVLDAPLEIQKEYVKGFFDSEGGVPHVECGNVEPKNIRIHFTQSNRECLEGLKQIISDFGIKTGNICGPYFKKGYTNPVYRLKIHGIREVAKFFDNIGSLHPEKSMRLSLIRKGIQVEA